MLYTIERKITVLEFLFNQPVASYFFNKRLQHSRFLVDIAKLSRRLFLQEQLDTPDSIFMEHICNYNNIKYNVNLAKVAFSTICWDKKLINVEMPYEIILFPLFWFCKICY